MFPKGARICISQTATCAGSEVKALLRWLMRFLAQDMILPDLDAQINHDALLALKNLLEMQPQLHDVLFNSSEHKQGDQSSEEASQL